MAPYMKKRCQEMKVPDKNFTKYFLKWLLFKGKTGQMFCFLPKSASMSFQSAAMRSNNQTGGIFTVPHDTQPLLNGHFYSAQVFPHNYMAQSLRQHAFYSFAVVRYPFTRLLSAYKFKFIPFNEYIRNNKTLIPDEVDDPLTHKVAQFAVQVDPEFWTHGVSFETFLRFIVSEWKAGKLLDLLWMPFEQFCAPCSIPYDYVGRFEDLNATSTQFLRLIHGDQVPVEAASHFPHYHQTPQDTNTVLGKYYSSVNTFVIQDILEIYKYDFELFGYEKKLLFSDHSVVHTHKMDQHMVQQT